jgi:hypothetical protein
MSLHNVNVLFLLLTSCFNPMAWIMCNICRIICFFWRFTTSHSHLYCSITLHCTINVDTYAFFTKVAYDVIGYAPKKMGLYFLHLAFHFVLWMLGKNKRLANLKDLVINDNLLFNMLWKQSPHWNIFFVSEVVARIIIIIRHACISSSIIWVTIFLFFCVSSLANGIPLLI